MEIGQCVIEKSSAPESWDSLHQILSITSHNILGGCIEAHSQLCGCPLVHVSTPHTDEKRRATSGEGQRHFVQPGNHFNQNGEHSRRKT